MYISGGFTDGHFSDAMLCYNPKHDIWSLSKVKVAYCGFLTRKRHFKISKLGLFCKNLIKLFKKTNFATKLKIKFL